MIRYRRRIISVPRLWGPKGQHHAGPYPFKLKFGYNAKERHVTRSSSEGKIREMGDRGAQEANIAHPPRT